MIINHPTIQPLVSDQMSSDIENSSSNLSLVESKTSTLRRKNVIFCISFVAIILLIGVALTGLFIYKEEKIEDVSAVKQTRKNIQIVISQDQQLIYSERQRLVLTDSHKISASDISNQKFPNLKSLVINSPNLVSLELDSQLRLDSLVINNSKLTSFSYNSTELKTILLIDNQNMVEFIDSSLPSLSNLTVTRTNIQKWQNIRFGNLTNFRVSQCSTNSLPEYNATSVEQFQVINCSNSKPLSSNYLRKFPIRKIRFENFDIKAIDFYQDVRLQEFELIGGTMSSIQLRYLPDLHKIKIESQSVKTIYFYLCQTLKDLEFKLPSLENLQLISVNIDSLQRFSLQNLTKLHMRDVPLKSFNNLQFPKIKQITIDYSLMNQTIFNITSSTLEYLSLNRYKSSQPLNSNKLPKLNSLSFQNFNVSRIDVSQLPRVKELYLSYMKSSELNLTLNNNIEILKLSDLTLKQFSNHTLDNLRQLLLLETTVESIEHNNFPKLYEIGLFLNKKLKSVRNNNFDAVTKIQIHNIPLLELDQVFPSAVYATYEYSNPQVISNLSKCFPNVDHLQIYENTLQTIKSLELPKLTTLLFEGEKLNSFQNNTLLNLQILKFDSDLVTFKNNNFKNILWFELWKAASLDFDVLLEEFERYASEEIEPQVISVYKKTKKEIIDKIKEIFPNTNVITY